MGQIMGVAESTASRIEPTGRRTKDAAVPADQAPSQHGRDVDRVELSETAKRAGGVGDTGVRMDLIERIRREIEAGVYETPEKLDITAERIARVLDVQG
jgi:anti-sigma28 factor (negative regulator of flagellin synthesis)